MFGKKERKNMRHLLLYPYRILIIYVSKHTRTLTTTKTLWIHWSITYFFMSFKLRYWWLKSEYGIELRKLYLSKIPFLLIRQPSFIIMSYYLLAWYWRHIYIFLICYKLIIELFKKKPPSWSVTHNKLKSNYNKLWNSFLTINWKFIIFKLHLLQLQTAWTFKLKTIII